MVMLNSGMERITDIGTLLSGFQIREEERMVTRFHGVDRHKKYSTVSVLDRDGKEVLFRRVCALQDYVNELDSEDAVVLEVSGQLRQFLCFFIFKRLSPHFSRYC